MTEQTKAHVLTNTTSPLTTDFDVDATSTLTQVATTASKHGDWTMLGFLAGIGGVVLLLICIFSCLCIRRRKKRQHKVKNTKTLPKKEELDSSIRKPSQDETRNRPDGDVTITYTDEYHDSDLNGSDNNTSQTTRTRDDSAKYISMGQKHKLENETRPRGRQQPKLNPISCAPTPGQKPQPEHHSKPRHTLDPDIHNRPALSLPANEQPYSLKQARTPSPSRALFNQPLQDHAPTARGLQPPSFADQQLVPQEEYVNYSKGPSGVESLSSGGSLMDSQELKSSDMRVKKVGSNKQTKLKYQNVQDDVEIQRMRQARLAEIQKASQTDPSLSPSSPATTYDIAPALTLPNPPPQDARGGTLPAPPAPHGPVLGKPGYVNVSASRNTTTSPIADPPIGGLAGNRSTGATYLGGRTVPNPPSAFP